MMSSTAVSPRRPGLLTGLVVGALIAAAIIAVFFAAAALFRLPLLPINIMDWLPNNLPVDLLNAGKNAMVSVLLAISPTDIDGAAKGAEAIIGTATLFGIVVAMSAAVFLIARGRGGNAGAVTGVVLGAVVGIVLMLMYFSLPVVQIERSGYVVLDAVFIVGLLALAGYAAGRVSDTMSTLPADTADAPADVQQLNRRQFLVRVGGTTATLTVAGAVVSLLANRGGATEETTTATGSVDAPEVEQADVAPGMPVNETIAATGDFAAAPGTRPEVTPLEEHYRIDIVSRPPEIDASMWTLPLVGLVHTPQNITLEELRAMPSQSEIITMSCISNPVAGDLISSIKWTGVRMSTLIDMAQPMAEATHLRITCADGFDEYVSLATIRGDDRIMLAYAWDDRPLLQKHGFPVRIHIPNLYGMKQPKWITNIEFVEGWDEGYWVRRGWSADAVVQLTSVIDTVADPFEYEGTAYVPIGGIAYAGDRGIVLVEVKVDGGEWAPAAVKAPLSYQTWYVWRYDWPFTEGEHSFEVRAVDGDGASQRVENTPVAPDGATGIHRVNANL